MHGDSRAVDVGPRTLPSDPLAILRPTRTLNHRFRRISKVSAMPEPVLVAIPPKGGSLDDVLKKLVGLGWVKPEVVTAIRRLIKEDKRRVKLEEGLIALWQNSGFETQATMRA